MADTVDTGSALTCLREVAWMARRGAQPDIAMIRAGFSEPLDVASGEPLRVNVALWMLGALLAARNLDGLPADLTAIPNLADDGLRGRGRVPGKQPSVYLDGTPVDWQASAADLSEVDAPELTDEDAACQWLVDVLVPYAWRYAEGRRTYAASEFNQAVRRLRAHRFDLAATVQAHGTVWVTDGHGMDGLSAGERAEREAVSR